MSRRIHAILLWGASFYLATHGVLPPAASETEARALAAAMREAAVATLESHVRAAGSLLSRLLGVPR